MVWLRQGVPKVETVMGCVCVGSVAKERCDQSGNSYGLCVWAVQLRQGVTKVETVSYELCVWAVRPRKGVTKVETVMGCVCGQCN